MENKTRSSNASATTPSTLCDSGNHLPGHTSDSLRNDTPEQLLTPENSRSETSSNNESAPNYEKPTFRRTSTRATRASLRNTKQLGDAESKNNAETPRFIEAKRNGSDEAIVKNVCDENKTQPPALRHSMVIMELPQLSKNTLNCGNVESEDRLVAPDTPVSNLSHNQLAEDTSISIQQRASRKRVESALVKQDTHASEKSSTTKLARREPLRRSSRLSLPGRKSNFLDRLSTVLGKRPRDKIENEKESGRRASLRPRKAKNPGEEPASATPSAVASVKRRRVSESDIPSDPRSKDVGENPVKPLASTPKRWLTEGLYIGQEPTDAPPSQNRNKGTRAGRRKSTIIQQRRFLPLPMFAGARLLNNGRDFKLPFDVFSPVPPGQPKPDEWRKTNKNVFVGEAGSIWRANKPLELSKCLCTEETGCDENCQNRYMFYECDDGNCGLGRECGNRSFEELKQRTKAGGKYNIGVEVIKTSDRGYGVRSNRTFEPNQIIVEYTGEIITQTECERRMRTIYKSNECYYLMYFDQNMIIDATRGSIARFVNHSCEPNCRMEKWTVAGKPRMALFAGDRGIMTGEELSYDYNFDPYSQKNVQECRCGSANCRGVLGPRPREKEQRAKEPTLNTKKANAPRSGAKRKKVLDESASRLNKSHKLHTPRSIKAGIRNAVTKVQSTVSRSATHRGRGPATKETKSTTRQIKTRVPGTTKGRIPDGSNGKVTTHRKLPVTKARARVKTATRTSRAPVSRGTQSKSLPTKLTRPSGGAKARTANGSASRRQLAKEPMIETGSMRKRKNQYTKRTAKPRTTNVRVKTVSRS